MLASFSFLVAGVVAFILLGACALYVVARRSERVRAFIIRAGDDVLSPGELVILEEYRILGRSDDLVLSEEVAGRVGLPSGVFDDAVTRLEVRGFVTPWPHFSGTPALRLLPSGREWLSRHHAGSAAWTDDNGLTQDP